MSVSRNNSLLRLGTASRSQSRRPSRPRTSRDPSLASIPYLPQGPEALINPDGQIGEDAVELLQEFVHPHRHESETTLVEEVPEQDDHAPDSHATWRQSLPWWKRPSPMWFLILIPLASVAMSATMAPRIEIYTRLVCDAYRPEYTVGRGKDRLPNPDVVFSPSVILDDKTYELCVADPVVQKAVAKLSLAMITTMGVLGCLTTGWWGSLSDRFGRMKVMGFAAFGILITDFTFIFVAKFSRALPGGYHFLLLGPLVEGLLGGFSTVSAAIHAYIADCTDSTTRARAFSLFVGLMFIGVSIGPSAASLLISATGTVLSVFYVAAAVHIAYSIVIWFVIPESLSPAQRAQARKLHEEELSQLQAARAKGGAGVWLRWAFGFLSPLTLFFPSAKNANVGASNANPLKTRRQGWGLVLVAGGYVCIMMLMGSLTSKMQYTTLAFGWDSKNIGYWTSIIGAARAFHLTVVLPIAIYLCQPKTPAIHLPVEPDEPLSPTADFSPATARPDSAVDAPRSAPPAPSRRHHSPTFDLTVVRVSLAIDLVAYVLMASATNGTLYTVYSVLGSFGGGAAPALQSLASTLYAQNGGKELGKLFGAFGVLQAISSQVVGPSIYGVVYLRTVATFPKAVFFVSAGNLALAIVLLSCIRLLPASQGDEESVEAAVDVSAVRREETLADVQGPLIVVEDEDELRGRKPDVKVTVTAAD
ncbi:hypothetical protein IEO21_01884 [Rhodonia placenta]|uniref:Major facilitator superfamily (MFS) profile domain-containing protein n=1 Tax=Rhodonia placenta TaxID=104341 RepID=A0A8H7P8S1_9APHY|nr:hypothetical protein IEO21_01884 [Postia placenta]